MRSRRIKQAKRVPLQPLAAINLGPNGAALRGSFLISCDRMGTWRLQRALTRFGNTSRLLPQLPQFRGEGFGNLLLEVGSDHLFNPTKNGQNGKTREASVGVPAPTGHPLLEFKATQVWIPEMEQPEDAGKRIR